MGVKEDQAYKEWHEKYEVYKYLDPYGEDYELVKLIDKHHVWTECDESGAGTFINAGLYHINAIGYFITKNPWTDEWESITTRECK